MSEAGPRERPGWIVPAAIFLLAAVVYALLGRLQEIPLVAPDEFLYGHLARSVGSGEGLTWYGAEQEFSTRLYIYLLAPSWALASGESAYELAKLMGAVALSAVVFPVWVLARRVSSSALTAAVPTTLAVAGTWMITAGSLLSENLAYPLGTAALVCSVLALREPERRWVWIAIALAALATLGRAQMIVLFPIMLLALGLDVLRAERPVERIDVHRVPAIVLGGGVLAGLAIVLSGSVSLLGVYTEVSDFAPAFGDLLSATGDQWLALAISCAVLPLAALLAAGSDRAAWRDQELGPLLCVAAPAAALLIAQSGFFNASVAGDGLDWSIERYVQYAIPLLLVLLFAAIDRGLLAWRRLAIAGALVAATLLLTPEVRQVSEERARYATAEILGLDPRLAATLLAVLVVGACVVLLRRAPRRLAPVLGGLVLVVLALQSASVWAWQSDTSGQVRAQYPASLSWVDDNARGPVSRMYLFQNSALFQTADLFNERIERQFGPSVAIPGRPPLGPLCSWTASPRGVVLPSEGCPAPRGTVWNDDPLVQMSFHGGRLLARDPFLGQLIAVPAEPRLRSLIRNPCQRATVVLDRRGSPIGIPKRLPCAPTMSINFWLDAPGDLRLTFSGGQQPQRVRLGARTWRLAAGRPTTIVVPLNAAAPQLAFELSWTARQGTPRLVGATLDTGERREPLI